MKTLFMFNERVKDEQYVKALDIIRCQVVVITPRWQSGCQAYQDFEGG